MNKYDVISKIKEIFIDLFDDIQDITDDTSSKDIEDWDSLAQVTILSLLEKEFDIKFSLEEIPTLNTVGNMVQLIEMKLKFNK